MTDRPYIQLVGDRSENLKVLEKILLKQSYRVRAFINGELAMASAYESPPDLILLDPRISGMDGYELCQRLKVDGRTRDIPVLFLIALNNSPEKVEAFAAGGADCICKPFETEEVLARVVTHLTLSRVKQQFDLQNSQLQTLHQNLNQEIARRKQSEVNLSRQHSILNAVLESSDSPIFSLNRDFCYTSFNQAHAGVMKALYNADIKLGNNLLAFQTNKQDRETARRNLERALQGEVVIESAYSGEEVHGRRYFEVVHNPIRNEADQVIGVSVFARDVTERKQAEEALENYHQHLEMLVDERTIALQEEIEQHRRAEEALRESEARYRELADSITDVFFAMDENLRYTYWNRASEKLTGVPAQDAIGKSLRDLFPNTPQIRTAEEIYRAVLRSKQPHNFINEHQIGEKLLFLEISAYPTRRGLSVFVKDITERKQAEEALQARTRELALLNSAGRAFVSSLELEQVFTTVLEQVRRIIGIVACSIWLIDPESGDLVCRVASPTDDIVRGWRLALGQGLAGRVVQHGESLNVPDAQIDRRHFKRVDHQTGLKLRSILSVPLRAQKGIFGVLQLLDEAENRFSPNDVRLAESLAALASIAIENARLYRQTQEDAIAKTLLLQEVNHRVKNNLAAIAGMLYIERRYAQQSGDLRPNIVIIDDLVNRIEGLAMVHHLLSNSNWSPLPLTELTRQVIDSVLHARPPDRQILVDVLAAAPVKVGPKEAHNLAIVINELVTNVVKYAAPSQETTQITVRITPEPDGETILFEFKDDGPGFPEEVLGSEGRNVGLYLIENTVRHSLRGEITLHNDKGATVTIRFVNESITISYS